MKKLLVGTAGILCAGLGWAQSSSLTLFGVADVSARRVVNSGVSSVNQLASGAWSTSRIGLRGTEDLGGGLSASFWLEGALLIDSGTGGAANTNNQNSGGAAAGQNGSQGITFGRRSTVSLAGNWGELRVGRDLTPQIYSITYYDPFYNLGVGASQTFNSIITGATSVRASNMVNYFTPNMGGLFGQVAYYVGENLSNGAATAKDGTGGAVRFGYATPKLELALTVSETSYAAGDVHQNNFGGIWDIGVAKISGSLSDDTNGKLKARGGNLGADFPIQQHELKIAYSQYHIEGGATSPMMKKLALGWGYNLSKRSTLYVMASRVDNSGGGNAAAALGAGVAAINGKSTGMDVGIRHAF